MMGDWSWPTLHWCRVLESFIELVAQGEDFDDVVLKARMKSIIGFRAESVGQRYDSVFFMAISSSDNPFFQGRFQGPD